MCIKKAMQITAEITEASPYYQWCQNYMWISYGTN
jgi:hypothetical protein